MKRFITTVILVVVILGVMLYFTPKSMCADALTYSDCNAVVNIYCRKTDCDAVDLGFGYMVTCSTATLPHTLDYCYDVDGISVSFCGTMQDVDKVANRLQARLVNEMQLGDLYVACFVSPRLKESVTLDGKRVNLQIAYHSGTVTVGYPLILGSY